MSISLILANYHLSSLVTIEGLTGFDMATQHTVFALLRSLPYMAMRSEISICACPHYHV